MLPAPCVRSESLAITELTFLRACGDKDARGPESVPAPVSVRGDADCLDDLSPLGDFGPEVSRERLG